MCLTPWQNYYVINMTLKNELTENKFSLLLFFAVLGLDQISKFYFASASILNPGIIFGHLSSVDPLIRIIFFSTLFTLILFLGIFIKFYYLSSPRFRNMTFALSVFLAGIAGNAVDRIRMGRVIDFIAIPSTDYKANLADFFQIISFFVLIYYLFNQGSELFYENGKRRIKLVDPNYQMSFAFKFCLISFFSMLVMGTFSFVFMKVYNPLFNGFLQGVFLSYWLVLFALVLLLSFVFGLILSQRKIGPILALKRFVTDIKNGKEAELKLRELDSFKELEEISKDIHEISRK
jgi:lipoprotein signal peptidase